MVNAGAKVNVVNEYSQSALVEATIGAEIFQSPDIVIYLIEKGADFRRPLDKTIEGKNYYITNALREWRFDLESDAYRKKMQLVDFLKKNGMDYWKVPNLKSFKMNILKNI